MLEGEGFNIDFFRQERAAALARRKMIGGAIGDEAPCAITLGSFPGDVPDGPASGSQVWERRRNSRRTYSGFLVRSLLLPEGFRPRTSRSVLSGRVKYAQVAVGYPEIFEGMDWRSGVPPGGEGRRQRGSRGGSRAG